jgi:hypothetical protein
MGTRSSIARKNEDGTVTAIYCHWDGYPSNNGRILENYYKVPLKLDTLLSLGDVSSLGAMIGEQHPFDNPNPFGSDAYRAHDELHKGWTKFYGRDRGEKNIEAQTYSNVKEWVNERGEEYNYLSIDGTWFVNDHGEVDNAGLPVFTELGAVLAQKEVADG